jgi:tetratricopeptide (TPR) repeat protein
MAANRIRDFTGTVISLIILIIIGIFLIILVFDLRGFYKQNVFLEPFEVAPELKKQGFTSQVISNKLLDHIEKIKKNAINYCRKPDILFLGDISSPDIEVPATTISIKAISKYIKDKINYYETTIGGELIIQGKKPILTMRFFKDNSFKSIDMEGDLDNINALIKAAAQKIMEYKDPITLASYFHYAHCGNCIAVLKDCLHRPPADDDIWALRLWSNALCHQGDYNGAAEKIRLALEKDPKCDLIYLTWGKLLREQGNYEGAIEKYQKCTDINPTFGGAYVNWGEALLNQGETEKAIEKCRIATIYGSKIEKIYGYVNWAFALIKIKKYKEAEGLLKKAIEMDPENAGPYFAWGSLLDELEKYKDAIEKYQQAAELDPNLSLLYINWSASLINISDYDGAIEKTKKAIELGNKRVKALAYLNWACVDLKKNMIKEAIAKTKIAIQLYPNYPRAHYKLGCILMEKGDYKGALESFKNLLEIDPQGPFSKNAEKLSVICKKRL